LKSDPGCISRFLDSSSATPEDDETFLFEFSWSEETSLISASIRWLIFSFLIFAAADAGPNPNPNPPVEISISSSLWWEFKDGEACIPATVLSEMGEK
jgi:hypothetical protein